MDEDKSSDQRLEHHRTPAKYISMEELRKDTGVEYFQVRYRRDFIIKKLTKMNSDLHNHQNIAILLKNCDLR